MTNESNGQWVGVRRESVEFQIPYGDGSNRGSRKETIPNRSSPRRSSSSLAALNRYDYNLLRRAVSDAGRWAYGIILVELWVLNENRTFLFRPDGGWWIDPMYHRDCGPQCQICRLTQEDRDDDAAPRKLSPGEGLAGALWSEVSSAWTKSWRETLAGRLLGNTTAQVSPEEIHFEAYRSRIVWRDVQQLDADPDQPWNARLKLLSSVGLGWAAAVPFNLHGDQGIVIYMARNSVDRSRLKSETNESYLISASDLIASAYALRGPRQDALAARRKELSSALHRVRDKILALHRSGINVKDYVDAEAAKTKVESQWMDVKSSWVERPRRTVVDVIKSTLKKSAGGGSHPPPSLSWRETLLTLVGVFLTILVVTSLGERVAQDLGEGYNLALGPFGAVVTLLYGLSSAPASQPRNVLLGQLVSMTIAMVISYLETVPLRFRESLATALAVAAMVKLGITHPPAGAFALVFASEKLGWGSVSMVLIANVIAVLMATLINNLSTKRQYPLYWTADWPVRIFRHTNRSNNSKPAETLVNRLSKKNNLCQL